MSFDWAAEALGPYAKSSEVFFCPSDRIYRTATFDGVNAKGSYDYPDCFFLSDADAAAHNNHGPATARSSSEVEYPAQKVLSFECAIFHDQGLMAPDWRQWSVYWWKWEANLLFVDGHVKYLRRTQLVSPGGDPNWTTGGVRGKDID
jgi:prepilin-type processing-associated H-X9-DG protein